jgi:uncharacterized protein YwbE
LFSNGKKPIEVTIKLGLKADVVDKLYQQFWKLEGGVWSLHVKGVQ